jgi:hypothetical protein
MPTLELVMAGHSASEHARERAYVPAIHVLLADREKDVDARQRRQVYAVYASLTALLGMTHETPSYVCTQIPLVF